MRSRAPACTRATTTRAPRIRRAARGSAASPISKSGTHGFAFASGMAATSTLLELHRRRQPHRRDERSVRRHVPRVRTRAATFREPRHQLRRSDAARESGQGRASADAHDLDRNADQSDAAPGRHRAGRGVRASARHSHGRRQHVRESVDPAAAGARRRHRDALGDEISERPLRHGRRRRCHGERRSWRRKSRSCRTRSVRSPVRSTASSRCAA